MEETASGGYVKNGSRSVTENICPNLPLHGASIWNFSEPFVEMTVFDAGREEKVIAKKNILHSYAQMDLKIHIVKNLV